jgi:hypothetical protein
VVTGSTTSAGVVLSSGGITVPLLAQAPASPGADKAVLYLLAGTNSGVSLRVKAGTAGAEQIIEDDIPVS